MGKEGIQKKSEKSISRTSIRAAVVVGRDPGLPPVGLLESTFSGENRTVTDFRTALCPERYVFCGSSIFEVRIRLSNTGVCTVYIRCAIEF